MDVRRIAAVLVVAILLVLAGSAATATAAPAGGPAAAQAPEVVPILIRAALVNVARRYLLRSVAKYVVKQQVERWVTSGGVYCPPLLPRRYFCAGRATTFNGVGLAWPPPGYGAVTLHAGPSFGYAAPGWAPFGHALGLVCYVYGQWGQGYGGPTNLWYLLPSGWYAFDGLLYTGTRGVVPGVPRC